MRHFNLSFIKKSYIDKLYKKCLELIAVIDVKIIGIDEELDIN